MTECLIECTSIPDGFVDGGAEPARLSIVLRPKLLTSQPEPDAVVVDAAVWPTEIPKLEFQVWAGTNATSMRLIETISAGSAFEGDETAGITPKAQKWWDGLWQGSPIDYYLELLDGAGSDLVGRAEVKSYDYAKLHQTAIHDSLHELQRAYFSHAVKQMASDKNSGIELEREFAGLTLRAARDPNDSFVRVARELARSRLGATATARRGTIHGPTPFHSQNRPKRKAPSGRGIHAILDPAFAAALDPENFDLPFAPTHLQKFDPAEITATYDDFEEVMKTDDELGAVSTPLEEKYDRAHEILGKLQAHPALRKFARQIADISVDIAKLRAACGVTDDAFKGLIAVSVKRPGDDTADELPEEVLKTAFELRTVKDPLFEPCPRSAFAGPADPEEISASLPLRDGFVYAQTIRGERRFQVASIDGIAAYFSETRARQATLGAYHSGAAPKDAPTEPQGFRTRGLMLLDTMAKETATAGEKRIAEVAKDRILYAEDLIDGYRVDVVAPNGSVFPTCARRVEYQAFADLTPQQRRVYDTERNDGSISPLGRTWSKDAQTFLAVSQVIFSWSGANFGLPSVNEDAAVRYEFDSARLGPILRYLFHYRFMMRARKINGSSRPLSKDRLDEFALGSELDKAPQSHINKANGDRGYQFAFVEKAPAPTVLIDSSFKPDYGPDADDRETVSTMLVRTGEPDPKIRWLVSPVTGFNLGELQGQFDPRSSSKSDRDRAQQHARTGAYLYLQHEESGGFPPVKDGQMLLGQAFQLREPILVKDATAHYVDGTLRTVAARLVATKATPPQVLANNLLPSDPAFFPEVKDVRDFDPDGVVPIRVEARASGSSQKSRLYRRSDFKLKLPGKGGRTLLVPTICVDVAAGDTLELELWANRTADAFRANPAVAYLRSAKSQLTVLLDDDPKGDKSFYDFVRSQRVASLSDVIRLRIDHPVNRPLARPDLSAPLNAFRALDLDAWKAIVDNSNGIDQADAAKVFPTGRITFDRKTTGEIWAEAFWRESEAFIVRTGTQEVAGLINQKGLYRQHWPVQFKRLFSISKLPLPDKLNRETTEAYLQRINEIDLLLEDPDPIANPSGARVARGLTADFDCDRYRTFAVRLVARSRFAPANSGAPSAQIEEATQEQVAEDDAFTQASATRAACQSAISNRADPDAAGWSPGVFRITVPATARPSPPYPTREQGTVYHRTIRADERGSTLSYIYRVWFDGNWGDEEFAIVCRRPRSAKLADWADAQLSRWGGDMATVPGQALRITTDLASEHASYLQAGQIVSAEEKVATLWREDGDDTAEISLACLKPVFHDGFGRFYCDVELKPTGAFKAGLKLMVARYQEHSISGRQLSSVIPIDTVMLPQPWHFTATRQDKNVLVTITGPAYQGRAPMLETLASISKESTMRMLSNLVGHPISIDIPSLVQSPLIVAELERFREDGEGPMPVFDGGRLVIASNLQQSPETVVEHIDGFSQPLSLKRWYLSLPIPDEDSEKLLSVRISLASAHANSHARLAGKDRSNAEFQPSALDGPLIFLPEPIVIDLTV